MGCREIPAGSLTGVRTLDAAAEKLGLFKGAIGNVPPPKVVYPEAADAVMADFSYLIGAGTTNPIFNVNKLFEKAGAESALQCTLAQLGYDENRAKVIDQEANQAGTDFDMHIAKLSDQDALNYNIFATITLLDYFRATPGIDPASKKNIVGGNSDGVQDQISTTELDSWAMAVTGWKKVNNENKQNELNQAFVNAGGDVISRFHALLALSTFVSSEEPTGPSAVEHTAGNDYRVAPEGGKKWISGDKIRFNGIELNLNLRGKTEIVVPGDKLPAGTHTIEVVRAGKAVQTITLDCQDPWHVKAANFVSDNWGYGVAGLAIAGVVGGLAYLLRRPKPATLKAATPPPPPVTPPVQPEQKAEQKATATDPLQAAVDQLQPGPKAEKQTFYIGRDNDSDIQLDFSKIDPMKASLISRKHVALTMENGVLTALDKGGNKYMAYLERGGQSYAISRDAATPSVLQAGDVLDIGGERFQVMGAPTDTAKPSSILTKASTVLLSPSLIIQNNPIATSNNGQNGSHGTPLTNENIALKLIDNFPSTMRGADGKSLHSDYQALLNDMIAMVKADTALTPTSLEAVAARASDAVFKEYAVKSKAFSADLRVEFVRLADMAEQKAITLEKSLKEARPAK